MTRTNDKQLILDHYDRASPTTARVPRLFAIASSLLKPGGTAHRQDVGLCLDIIKDKALWQLAATHGPDFVRFLCGFKAMRDAFSSGHFV